MWIVKLGGSLNEDALLPRWLSLLASEGAGRAVIVPGGGNFTNQVRLAQHRWGFNDSAAHYMAIMGMAQTAMMLTALEPRLALAEQETEIHDHIADGRSVVWLPLNVARPGAGIQPGWDISADSLALWLAGRTAAEGTVLIKSCTVLPHLSLQEQVRLGVLDDRFP